MRQNFSEKGDSSQSAARIAKLRDQLEALGVHGFLVPRSDEHQGEYVAPSSERLAWLTGFTGSAGMAIILDDQAAIFVDGRYTIQVRDQIDLDIVDPLSLEKNPPHDWLSDTVKKGLVIGYSPWLHTPADVERFSSACLLAGATLKPLDPNPIDMIWEDRPAPPSAPASVYKDLLAGKSSYDKRHEIGAELEDARTDAALISLPDSVAWLLNIRGDDVPCTPVTLSFALLHSDGTAEWFVDPAKIDDTLRAHLGQEITVAAPDSMGDALSRLGASGKTVQLDANSAPSWAAQKLERAGAKLKFDADPCLLPKACKTKAEQDGARTAHKVDAVAITRFLAWIAAEAPKGGLDEIAAAKKLELLREETGALRNISFESISAAGPHGAICHYRVTEQSNLPIEPGTLFLIDSGGQYLEGTTDITRTMAIGTPTEEMKDRFTRVLKGMIDLTLARFPEGTLGIQLDTIARAPLWEVGCDYDHGTGHGVGAYLSVHEGPQSISKRLRNEPMRPGMICSNEPGFYKAGEYGIRIENLVLVSQAEMMEGGDRPMMGFETLTFAPIDRTLIIPEMLTPRERDWLNAYHKQVFELVGPQVDTETRAWLEEATQPV